LNAHKKSKQKNKYNYLQTKKTTANQSRKKKFSLTCGCLPAETIMGDYITKTASIDMDISQ